MKNCGDTVLQNFLEALVDALKEYNEDSKYYNQSTREDLEATMVVDIPFVVSSLWQSFSMYPEKYSDFKSYLSNSQYFIDIYSLVDNDNEYGMYRALVTTYDQSPIHYVINFSTDERYWGHCECTPEDPDYREDKQCCGHGCDWEAPAFLIEKVKEESYSSWNGDEHDYWDFEDSYYQDDKNAAEEKKAMEKQLKIDFLKQQIKHYEDELKKLESDG